jgi:hypothetical protein
MPYYYGIQQFTFHAMYLFYPFFLKDVVRDCILVIKGHAPQVCASLGAIFQDGIPVVWNGSPIFENVCAALGDGTTILWNELRNSHYFIATPAKLAASPTN